MISFDRNSSQPWLTTALLGALVLALGGLLVAFMVSFNLADRQYRLAMLSERQAIAVSQIAELAGLQSGAGALNAALGQYRTLIAEETTLLPADPSASLNQRQEVEDAVRLASLARNSRNATTFRTLAEQIAQREAREVATARQELDRLHGRTIALAVALAVAVLLCAFSVAWLLVRRNRLLEAMVQARTARLEEIDQSRRLFFAKVSHELRTPVTAMRGEAEVALLDPQSQTQALREAMSHILANAAYLAHRIDELLGLASADDGKLQLGRCLLDVGKVIEDAMGEADAFARSVETKVVRTGQDDRIWLTGDARWLRQALLAVIENGLKYSPIGGELAIDLSLRGQVAKIAIMDKGPGVMPEDLPRIFEAYYQSEPGRQRGGNGLGLALARWVVEQHGGTICAVNRQEGGCTITIALPLEVAP